MIRLFKDNRSPALTDTITVDGTAVDLTGASVKFRMRQADKTTLKVDAAATITGNPTSGTVQYAWSAADLDTAAGYRAWWNVTFPSTLTQDTPEFDLRVVGHTASATDLCDVWDVRVAMNLPQQATGSEDQIQMHITEASDQIIKWTAREFTPVGTNLTRRFKVKRGRVDFYPYDLNKITAATLHPESMALALNVDVLSASPDVELRPFNSSEGVYTSLILSPWRPIVSQVSMKFGSPQIDIVGDWGWPTIPPQVRRACVLAVRSWIRKDQSAYANTGLAPTELIPTPQGTYALPQASKAILRRFKRDAGLI